jgi:hypothetical protein
MFALTSVKHAGLQRRFFSLAIAASQTSRFCGLDIAQPEQMAARQETVSFQQKTGKGDNSGRAY